MLQGVLDRLKPCLIEEFSKADLTKFEPVKKYILRRVKCESPAFLRLEIAKETCSSLKNANRPAENMLTEVSTNYDIVTWGQGLLVKRPVNGATAASGMRYRTTRWRYMYSSSPLPLRGGGWGQHVVHCAV